MIRTQAIARLKSTAATDPFDVIKNSKIVSKKAKIVGLKNSDFKSKAIWGVNTSQATALSFLKKKFGSPSKEKPGTEYVWGLAPYKVVLCIVGSSDNWEIRVYSKYTD